MSISSKEFFIMQFDGNRKCTNHVQGMQTAIFTWRQDRGFNSNENLSCIIYIIFLSFLFSL